MIMTFRRAALAVATVAALGFLSAGAASAASACARGAVHAHADGHAKGYVHHARHACRHHGWRHHHAHRAHAHRTHGVRVTYGVPVVPRYYVNQGPALTGPGVLVADIAYIDAPLSPGYPYIRSYDGGPYANATAHYHERRYSRHARPAGPGIERANAVIRTIGPNRVDIELYRKD